MFFDFNLSSLVVQAYDLVKPIHKSVILSWLSVVPLLAQEDLVRTEINESISLEVPASFLPMSQQDLRNKFISYRLPLAGFTSPDRSVDLVINQNPTPWRDQDIELLKEFYQNNIRNLFDTVQFFQETVKQINDRNYAVFEFISTVHGDPNSLRRQAAVVDYTWVQYTVKDQQAYVFSFNCPASLRERWQSTADKIMSSIIWP